MASKVLSIEISNELIKLCEVNRNAKSTVVNRAVVLPTPEGSVDDGSLRDVGAVADVISNAIRDNVIGAKDVIMTVQSTKIASKEAVIPYMKNGSKINDLVRANASEYFPVNNIEDYSLTHTVLETVQNDKEKTLRILAMAAPVSIISPYYELARRLALNVVAIDYLGNSTLQMLKTQIDDAPSMVIQIGNDSTIINVMKNKVLQFQRTVPYGRSSVINAVMETKKLSYNVALELLGKGSIIHETFDGEEITESLRFLVNSINRIVDYYISRNQNNPIEKAYIMGEGASVVGIEKLFANELNIDFAKITELQSVETDKFFRISKQELIQYMSTIGACIAPVNFTLATSKGKGSSSGGDVTKYLLLGVVAAVVVAVVLVAVPGIRLAKLNSSKKDYENKIKEIEGARITYNKWKISNDKASSLKDYYQNRTGDNNDYFYEFLVDLGEILPTDVSVSTISSNNGQVSMNIYSPNKATLARTIMQLKSIPYVYLVTVNGGNETMSSDGLVTVTSTVTLGFIDPTKADMIKDLDSTIEKEGE